MKSRSWLKALRGQSLRDDLEDVGATALRYVKEETLVPLKNTGRFAAYGALGSVFVAFGTGLLLLAALRFFQEQFPVFRGTLSWIPYFIVAVLAILVTALTVWRVVAGAGGRRLKDKP
ncbi:MAG: phage holin family protein [Acidobacteriota bacterium]|nr:phage holin family protein [Acidobacteriota bacterium]